MYQWGIFGEYGVLRLMGVFCFRFGRAHMLRQVLRTNRGDAVMHVILKVCCVRGGWDRVG